jgi:putative FmdB family regulatory protein
MPAYDYRCAACRHVFEKNQRITEAAGAECPQCGHHQCERLITGGTFHLKGSGWYASDYGGKAPEPASEAPAPACDGSGCGGGGCALAEG